mgnify:CR=1 FL=1|tara:strand:+ start:1188 stop:1721 length:534 start_codon:yes stop_codon:yes gene_type:complete
MIIKKNKKKIYSYKDLISIYKFDFVTKTKDVKKDFHKIILKDAVMIIVKNEVNEILFVKQYRPGVGKSVYELPGGMVEKKETPIIAAKRELKEETGIQVKKIVKILNYYRHSGYNCGQDTIFFTKVLKKNIKSYSLDNEILEIKWIDIKKLKSLIKKNYFECPGTISSLLQYINFYF